MTIGDRIKTRQQLLDEQADAAHTRESPGNDPHDQSTHPRQEHHSTVQPMQDGTNLQSSVDAGQQEVTKLRERMAVIKQEITDDVNRNWSSAWRTPAMFELMVKTRLTGHDEYRALQNRLRDAEATLPVESNAAIVPGTTR
ncbi:MAG: hypothetical protein M3325_13050 [Actinomycetota bacterium]|jgi:predicted RNase H-like nuclease (RuvC/YqgF family)|nr:hypothetical protein [Actinomycetota bacterium]MDQ3905484.1 hypothetical protein [Actinomycetota bacterium]